MTDLTPVIPEPQQTEIARSLLDFIDASPSPWHAVEQMAGRLRSAGYQELKETDSWTLQAGGRYYVVRGDSSLIALVLGEAEPAATGYRIVGAHTDSPGLRIKPNAAHEAGRMIRLGVEVYGSPILATFADRDLGLAGRVSLTGSGAMSRESRLLHVRSPIMRIPNLAIHMNRGVNEEGLKLERQTELPPLLAGIQQELPPSQHFKEFLAAQLGVAAQSILSWDLNVYDTQAGGLYGIHEEFYANGQIDNLASCHAALTALLDTQEQPCGFTRVIAFFDHEEVGSMSYKGADGSFLEDVLERTGMASGASGEGKRQAYARSFLVSADMAHAYHPNFEKYYDPQHGVRLNGGPVIKINASQRYATDSLSEAGFQSLCHQAGVPWQKYVHRSNLPCGSTIGPITSSRLGIRSVDVGNPMWSMHSARECAGVIDQDLMIRVLRVYFSAEGAM